MAKVFTIPVRPEVSRRKRAHKDDVQYVEGQRVLVQAMRYLAKSDPKANRPAIELLFDHFQERFRISDSPLK